MAKPGFIAVQRILDAQYFVRVNGEIAAPSYCSSRRRSHRHVALQSRRAKLHCNTVGPTPATGAMQKSSKPVDCRFSPSGKVNRCR